MTTRRVPVKIPPGLKARALQEIVRGIAVEQRAYTGTFGFQAGVADDDQASFLIGDVEKTVKQLNRAQKSKT